MTPTSPGVLEQRYSTHLTVVVESFIVPVLSCSVLHWTVYIVAIGTSSCVGYIWSRECIVFCPIFYYSFVFVLLLVLPILRNKHI